MKQLIQNFKTGELYVDELPVPAISEGFVLIANRYSLISAGTEKTTVSTAQASLIGKAKMRPDLVKQVIQNYKKEGLKATIDKVKTKLDSLKALGYSSAGVVLASMDTGNKFQPGDFVACAGLGYASHAEVVCVPQNLVARIPDGVDLQNACYTTLGAISLQGIRQADPKLGDNICVIGLGLLGQITCQILKANGCNVFGIDVSPKMVELANQTHSSKALVRNDPNLMTAIENFTNGFGFDKVIITAAGQTNDPVELSGQILRKKGTVVVVGAVKMDVPRDPDFYQKELELKLSCSYGPGRYDNKYEEQGLDYPYGYVRWTEQRNMEAFLGLVSNGSIDLKPLTTHVFSIEDALHAYDIVLGKKPEPFVGIVLKYSDEEKAVADFVPVNSNAIQNFNIGFIGAGSFAQSYLIPSVKGYGSLDTVVTRDGLNSKNVAQKFGFNRASSNPIHILENQAINTLFIATQHDTHVKYAMAGLKNNKAVYVEKPLAMNVEELNEIIGVYENSASPMLMVGFNRRFAHISQIAKASFKNTGEPLVMNFRVNAGFIPKDHWTQTSAGGGRIIGEICHFIDLMQFFTDSEPVKVYAECIDSRNDKLKNDDNLSIVVKFADGSVGNLVYTANGDKALPKERFEIFGGNAVFIIDDFRQGILFHDNKDKIFKTSGKGHKQEIEAFFHGLSTGSGSPIPFRSICLTTLVTFKIVESLATGQPQEVQF
ncbi:MAG: bi-domain-containing oxidoreductase [Bacteroidales bacterium]|nr:bi-domain-containing oxidoreductase [Bacteroidales bacterium]